LVKVAAGKLKLIAIIASLAGLALVLSPTFSLLQFPGASTTQGDGFPEDASFIPDDTEVEVVSDEDLVACNSFNENVDEILGVSNDTVDDRKLASDTLIAEFCNRPVLIKEIMSMDSHGLSLVAYACDASAGKIGTEAIQESLSEYYKIYCDSARKLILDESKTFLASVEEFRTEILPMIEASQEEEAEARAEEADTSSTNDTTSVDEDGDEADTSTGTFDTAKARATLEKVKQSLEECITLVNEFEYYPAARSFDNASKMFLGIFTEKEP
jgi:hypothetical protein